MILDRISRLKRAPPPPASLQSSATAASAKVGQTHWNKGRPSCVCVLCADISERGQPPNQNADLRRGGTAALVRKTLQIVALPPNSSSLSPSTLLQFPGELPGSGHSGPPAGAAERPPLPPPAAGTGMAAVEGEAAAQRGHSRSGAGWAGLRLLFPHSLPNVSVAADEMGLGKTLSIISLILENPSDLTHQKDGMWTPVVFTHVCMTYLLQITKLELACSSGWIYIVYACLALPCLAYITVDLNPADWAASVAQLAEHWTSNPVVTGSNPVRGSSVFFSLSAFGLCLTYFPSLLTFPCAYTCTRLIMYMYMYVAGP